MNSITNTLNKTEQGWLKACTLFVKDKLKEAEKAHDWHHIDRVFKNCCEILKTEEADTTVVFVACLFHDLADLKFTDNTNETMELLNNFLNQIQFPKDKIERVIYIVENVSFSGGHFKEDIENKELQIVRDADKLDAIGAIGIARCFQYGGYKNRIIFDPKIKPIDYKSKETYYKSEAPSLNHFYEKLLLLKDLIKTSSAKKIAQERHDFMVQFLEQFHNECGEFNS